MVKINKITEPKSYLYHTKLGLIGEVNSHLELNDICLQIKKSGEYGYYIAYEGNDYAIESNGRIQGGGNIIYPLLSKQLHEIMGF